MKWVFVIFLVTLVGNANAKPLTEKDIEALDSWFGLITYLKDAGVETSRVDWGEVGAQCSGFKRLSDKTRYNYCRYEKAINNYQHTQDRWYCKKASKLAYPVSSVSRFNDTSISVVDNQNGLSQTTRVRSRPRNVKELNDRRDYFFEVCMREEGWINSNNWRAGRR
jgi:hypothetical protein